MVFRHRRTRARFGRHSETSVEATSLKPNEGQSARIGPRIVAARYNQDMGIESGPRQINPDERMKNPHEDEPKDLVIETVRNPEVILDQETERVRWYLKEWKRYKELGYDSVIRLPAGVDPENENITDDEIRTAIQNEFDGNQADYEAYAGTFQETWNAMQEKMLPLMKQVYGFEPVGHFRIAPTAYGTGGGSLEKGGPVFFRLPKFRPNAGGTPITEIEAITHEILCHECTAGLREKTALDDSPIFATHQDVKELLMDYLGRTLLVRSGLMKREDVRMVGGGSAPEGFDFDSLYYADSTNPDENNLQYEGRLPELVVAITEKLRELPQAA